MDALGEEGACHKAVMCARDDNPCSSDRVASLRGVHVCPHIDMVTGEFRMYVGEDFVKVFAVTHLSAFHDILKEEQAWLQANDRFDGGEALLRIGVIKALAQS